MCNRVLCFWEFAYNGVAPSVHLERTKRADTTENPPITHILHGLGLETDWNSDYCCTGLQTTAHWDFSCPWWSEIAVKVRGRDDRGVMPQLDFWCYIVKMNINTLVFWHCVWSKKRFARRFCRNRYLKKRKCLTSFPAFDIKDGKFNFDLAQYNYCSWQNDSGQ